MPVKQTIRYLKLIAIYIFYNYFLKVFYHLLNPLIYAYSPENIDRDLFFEGKGDWIATKIASIIFLNIFNDLVWLLPFTIMNLYVFIKLIDHLTKGEARTYQYFSFILLKVYLFWCMIYLCYFGFVFFTAKTFDKDGGISPYFPYGSATIIYFLLGNFCFLLIFVPMWDKFIKKWVMSRYGTEVKIDQNAP